MLADMFVEEKSAGFLYGFPWEGTRARTERQMEMLKKKKKKKSADGKMKGRNRDDSQKTVKGQI